MARDFARAFYHSRAWERQRAYILKRDHYICTEPNCHQAASEVHHIIELSPENIDDVNITLNENNLRSLCHDCHTRITKAMKGQGSSTGILEPIAFGSDGMPFVVQS